jgi:hypothetical protein
VSREELEPRNLPELTDYAEANGWTLVEDAALPPAEWRCGPTGLPAWRLMFVKGDQDQSCLAPIDA